MFYESPEAEVCIFFIRNRILFNKNRRLITIDLEPHDKNDSGSKSVAVVLDSPCTKLTSAIPMSLPDTSAVEPTANEQLIKLQCIHSLLWEKHAIAWFERNKDACRLFEMFKPIFSDPQVNTSIISKNCSVKVVSIGQWHINNVLFPVKKGLNHVKPVPILESELQIP